MRTIPLTQGEVAIVDDIDYDFLMQWKWHCATTGYACRGNHKAGPRTVFMHRVILMRMGFEDFTASDHINGVRNDNRRCNLRPATMSQNRINYSGMRTNTSGYKGVNRCKAEKKWRARIMTNGKRLSLGSFDDPKDAAKAYNKAALKLHGEFARLNKV